MSTQIFANFVNTTLASPVATSDTSVTLASSANLPTLSAGQIMPLILNDAATGTVYEVMYVTAIAGATLTVTRGQEGTGAQAWATGDRAFSTNTKDTTAGANGNPSNAFSMSTATADDSSTTGATTAFVSNATAGVTAITGLTNADVTLTAAQAAVPMVTLAGTLTGNVNIIFPTTQKQWIVVNNASMGSNTITAKTSAGTGATLSAGENFVYGDGTNINGTVLFLNNQSLHDVTASRAVTTVYTNPSTTEWLTAFISVYNSYNAGGATDTFNVNGSIFAEVTTNESNGSTYQTNTKEVVLFVPPGGTYEWTSNESAYAKLTTWIEIY